MAEIVIKLNKEEQKEAKELQEYLKEMNKEQRLKFKGFLEGLKFGS